MPLIVATSWPIVGGTSVARLIVRLSMMTPVAPVTATRKLPVIVGVSVPPTVRLPVRLAGGGYAVPALCSLLTSSLSDSARRSISACRSTSV